MIRLLKIYVGLILTPVLFILSFFSLSWAPFRFFFFKRKKAEDGKGVIYLPAYSAAKFKETTIDSDIKAKHDMRKTEGKQAAFDEQNYRDQKHLLKEEIERQKRLKSLTSENKDVVTFIACIFASLFLLSLYFLDLSLLTFILLALTYFTYLYFKSEPIAKLFNAVIKKIKNISEKKVDS